MQWKVILCLVGLLYTTRGQQCSNSSDFIVSRGGLDRLRVTQSGGLIGCNNQDICAGLVAGVQTLSLAGSTLSISGGNSVDLPAGGDITGVTAGTGLTGGGLSGTVTLSADTAVLQSRVSASCAARNAISSISSTGTVTCEDIGWTLNAGNIYRPTGNVGVGISAPQTALDVQGIVRTTTGFRYNPPKTFFYSIAGSTFVSSDASWCLGQQDFHLCPSASAALTATAPIHLPQGSRVVACDAYIMDNSVPKDAQFVFSLLGNFLGGGAFAICSSVFTSSGASGNTVNVNVPLNFPGINPTIDNVQGYYASVSINPIGPVDPTSANLRVYHFRVQFNVTDIAF